MLVASMAVAPIVYTKHTPTVETPKVVTTTVVVPKVPVPLPKPKPVIDNTKDKSTCTKYLTYTKKYGSDVVDSNLKLRGYTDNQILKLRECKK